MQLKHLLPVALGAVASAQSLAQALASQNASLSTLSGILQSQPGLVGTLGSARNITILAPSNNALARFLNATDNIAIASRPDAIAALLTYHVLNGTYPASAFTNTTAFVPTLLSNATYANVTGGQVVGGALNGSDVVITSGLLQKSLVTTGDLNFTGGVIHVIDTVLTIPVSDSETAAGAGLTALAGALTQANLVETVNGLEDVTIFAPSNDAFEAIGSATGNLTTEQLSGILTYHVVQGTVGYSSILSNTTLKTVNGGNVTISIVDGDVYVNSAKVIIPDVLVANGVVHVIDGVLNPNNTSAAPNPSTTAPAFPNASSVSDTPFTSGVTASTTVTDAIASATSSSSSAGAAAMQTAGVGMMGMGALFGGAAIMAAGM